MTIQLTIRRWRLLVESHVGRVLEDSAPKLRCTNNAQTIFDLNVCRAYAVQTGRNSNSILTSTVALDICFP